MEKYDVDKRKKIIGKWNEKYFEQKRIKNIEKKNAQKKIDLAILQKKLGNEKKYYEDKYSDNDYDINNNHKNIDNEIYGNKEIKIEKDYINHKKREKIKYKEEYDDNDDETISKNDL